MRHTVERKFSAIMKAEYSSPKKSASVNCSQTSTAHIFTTHSVGENFWKPNSWITEVIPY